MAAALRRLGRLAGGRQDDRRQRQGRRLLQVLGDRLVAQQGLGRLLNGPQPGAAQAAPAPRQLSAPRAQRRCRRAAPPAPSRGEAGGAVPYRSRCGLVLAPEWP
eukprot:3404310-Lingulodinium_polyedra.AAC.1